MRKTSLASVCLAALVLASLSCSRSATIATKDGVLTVDQKGGDSGSMTFTSKDGKGMTVNIGGGKMPDDYPKDVPVYPDAKVIMTQSAAEKHTQNLMLESTDSTEKITEFYKKGLESNGWKIENTMTSGELTMLSGLKENRQIVLQIINSEDKRSINQILSDK